MGFSIFFQLLLACISSTASANSDSYITEPDLAEISGSFSNDVGEFTQKKRISSKSPRDLKNYYESLLGQNTFTLFNRNAWEISEFESDEELMAAVKSRPGSIRASPWSFTLHPSWEVRNLGYLNTLSVPPIDELDPHDVYVNHLDNKTREAIRGVANRRAFFRDPDAIAYTLKQTAIPLPSKAPLLTPETLVKNLTFLKKFLCMKFGAINPGKCGDALGELIGFMRPREFEEIQISAIPLLKNVFENEDYAKGAANAALKIMEKVEKSQKGESFLIGDFFSDLQTGFIEEGFAADRAKNMAWDLIGVYSTRSANLSILYPFVTGKKSSRTIVALETIATGMSVLDAHAYRLGAPLYSLPKGVKTVANYHKPYHFWMSAFLSRIIESKTGDRDSAVRAVSICQSGYQMISRTHGREHLLESILSSPASGSSIGKTKVDLAFSAAGAMYGASLGNDANATSQINIDDLVERMIEFNPDRVPLSETKAANLARSVLGKMKAYRLWMEIFRPDVVATEMLGRDRCQRLLKP